MHDIEHVESSCHVALGTDGGKPQPTHRRSHGQIFDVNPTPLKIEHVAGRTVAAIENGRQDATLITALRMSHALRTQVPNIFREQPFPKLIGSDRGESRTA